MALRLLTFLPVATLIACLALVSAASFVSAVDESALADSRPPIRLLSPESECDRLVREIHSLSHAATSCDSDPRCAESPLLCSAALDAEIDREYRALREALQARCGFPDGLLDYAWGGPVSAPPSCGKAHDWLEAATRGEAPATTFFF